MNIKRMMTVLSAFATIGLYAAELRADEYHARESAESSRSARLSAVSTPLAVSNVKMKQRDNSKLVDITYDLTGEAGTRCNIKIEICDNNSCIAVKKESGVEIGKGKTFVWDAGNDWPNNFSAKVTAKVTAEEIDVPATWAEIKISCNSDWLSACAYWTNRPTLQIDGENSGSTDSPYFAKMYFDGDGASKILLLANQGAQNRKYKIHFNNSLEKRTQRTVNVTVKSNGTQLSGSVKAAMRWCEAADTRDPYIAITFDAAGTPIAITKGN